MAKSPLQMIEHLHTKPHHVRERVALGATLAVFGLIFFVWLGTMRAHLSIYEENKSTLADETRKELNYIASPFAALKNTVTGLWSGKNNVPSQN